MLCAAIGGLIFAPSAAAGPPVATVGANGNALTGGLSFTPATVNVTVGDTVEWINKDILAPHTVTEDHGLFNLTGTYPPVFPLIITDGSFGPGFGPGETRQREFAAGTFNYFCEVHKGLMNGTIAAAMRLSDHPVTTASKLSKKKKKKHKKRKRKKHGKGRATATFFVTAVWAFEFLPPGQVFDVQRQQGNGAWVTVRDGTTAIQGEFDGGAAGTTSSYRARVRRSGDPASASDYSPVATITVG